MSRRIATWSAAISALAIAACSPSQPGEQETVASDTEAENNGRQIVQIDPSNDPRVWLEEVEGEEAMAWVEGQNERTYERLQGDALYETLFNEALSIYESTDRIPYGSFYAGYVWNFWQDSENTHGLWRRTSLESYLSDDPDWDVILDLDALSEAEGRNWVWRGSNCLTPDYDRCILTLSDGGSDAAVRREFLISERAFVEDGFITPESKGGIDWIDENTVMIGLAIGEEDSTDSGYASVAYRWERGTPYESATEIIRGDRTDVAMWGFRMEDSDGTAYMMMSQAVTFYDTVYWHLPDGGEPMQMPLPAKSSLRALYQDQLVFTVEEDWTPVEGGTTYAQGSVLSFSMSEFAANGELPQVFTVYMPRERQSVGSIQSTRSALLMAIDENVVGGIEAFSFAGDEWTSESVPVPENLTLSISSADSGEDIFFFNAEGFLTPDTLYMGNVADMTVNPIKSIPERFNAEGLIVEQLESTSADGTRIPYFVVRHEDTVMDGSTPTLLYAYGGFEVSIRPSYSGSRGRLWLERGGAYVVANIRGGGEFGPSWHQAGLKMDRQRIYDDLISVAEDMHTRGLTSPRRTAVYGGSNGGLLTGVMYTQRPDLWNAVVSAVPLLDMLRFHTLLAGASWMGEYGNPEDPDEGGFLRSISPYHNVDANGDYPEIYIYTSTKDDRVHPGHARKMAHLLEELGHEYLYYENTEGGHAAAADLSEYARRDAMLYTFLMQNLMGDDE
ncbi:MAG: S9 family peptidase [Maricaulis sp.]|uniref:prolyl oligopeptidase family serine peptidase n=1 Tax=Maricaulis sp. TaxID=1486257 RepID=UPI001B008840|nr:prolyl oligopeptidase family serine peptidase [Maricaulis sp.]MBO6728813.1 S9 family peptidase [Maricaulis sp.]MBO6847619.1 S9 family peptidase [Maricaulis sp.]MBO6876954.1 S9 family peptidase [Maricaulis sp.]